VVASHKTERWCEHMAKHKSSIHLPPPPAAPASPSAPAPRLVIQLLTVAGDLMIAGVCILGLVTAVDWLTTGAELRSRPVRQPQPAPREVWHCWWDRRYGGDICEPPHRLQPSQRYFMRDRV
jgi:hypothetical protein